MNLVMLIHGSRDPEYLSSVAEFSRRLGLGYSLMLNGITQGDGLTFPLFVEYGYDYERALSRAQLKVKPLLEWPGFMDSLISNTSGVVIMHGSRNPRFRQELNSLINAGIRAYLLVGEPNISDMVNHCPVEAYLLFLFRGSIVNKVVKEVKGICPGVRLRGPLCCDEWFISYLREKLSHLSLNGAGSNSLSL